MSGPRACPSHLATVAVVLSVVPLISNCGTLWGFDELRGDGVAGDASADATADIRERDATIDAGPASACAAGKPFESVSALKTLNRLDAHDFAPRLTEDELHVLFASSRGGQYELFEGERSSVTEDFATPVLRSTPSPGDPAMSADGLRLYFIVAPGGGTQIDLHAATRASLSSMFTFTSAIDLGAAVNSATASDFQPFETEGGLWFVSDRDGARHIWFAPGKLGAFATAARVDNIAGPSDDGWPAPSADGLVIYFSRSMADGSAIFVAERATTSDAFSPATLVRELDGPKNDIPHWLSRDRCRLYFTSDRDGTWNMFVARRTP